MASYRYCVVPCCKSSTLTCPDKYFFDMPRHREIRRQWCVAIKRDEKKNPEFSPLSPRHVCQDHFDLEKDTENLMRHRLQGVPLKLKPGTLPHIFDCQRKSKPLRTTGIKRKRAELLDALLSEESASPSTSTVTELLPPPENDPILTDEVPEKHDKGVQANLKSKIRSQGTSVKWPVVHRATSTSLQTCDVGVSPIKPQVAEWIFYSDSDNSNTPSCSDYEESNSEVEETMEVDLKASMQRLFVLTTEKNSRLCLGLPEKCYFLLQFLEKTVNCRIMNVMISLKKIRLNDQYEILAMHFGLTKSSICRIFNDTIKFIAPIMKKFIKWHAPQKIQRNLPVAFRARYFKVQAIIDCFETKVEKPTNPIHQSLTWSEYKKANTLKYLVSCTPDGFINYVSEGYGGRATDTAITEDCGFLEMLKPGMHVMADRGFKNISHHIEKKGCVLVRPPSVASNSQSSAKDVKQSKQIASLRIHIERVIGRLKEFKMLTEVIDHKLVQEFDSIVFIACGIINLQSCLFKNDTYYLPKY